MNEAAWKIANSLVRSLALLACLALLALAPRALRAQDCLTCHGDASMTDSAGHSIAVNGKDFVRIPVTACARMLPAVAVHAAFELIRLVGVAGLAIHRRNLVGMRIALDVRVAARAWQAAVNAVAEMLPVDEDAVAVAVSHARVAVTGEAVLRMKGAGGKRQKHQDRRERQAPNQHYCVISYGFVHSAVFLPWDERGCARSLAVPCRLRRSHKDCGGSHYKGRSLRRALAVIGVTGRAIQIT